MKKQTSKQAKKASKLAKAENLKKKQAQVIIVKNAEGDPDTTAEILIQNQINYTPKVSVIIPVYNVEQYLRQCLDSVVNQTLKEIEIICVDDGSTDSSLEILKEYAAKDKRMTVIRQQNLHAGVARNAGLSQAKGEYLSFLDSDDFFELNMLEEMSQKADEDKSDIVICGYLIFNEKEGSISKKTGGNTRLFLGCESVEYLKNLLQITNPMPWNKLFSQDIIKKNSIFFQSLPVANDLFFVYSSLAFAKKISHVPNYLINYRIFKKNSLSSKRDEHPFAFFDAFYLLKTKLENTVDFQICNDSFFKEFLGSIDWTYKLVKDKKSFQEYINRNIYKFHVKSPFLDEKIIISLTSYPARIPSIKYTIISLLNQSYTADKVILWLAPEQFPKGEDDLPQDLLELRDKGLTIDWYHDIKSYKKLIPALKKYPNDIIVTADDDLIYDKDWLKLLVNAHNSYPNSICCHRAFRITVQNGEIQPYKNWYKGEYIKSLGNYGIRAGNYYIGSRIFYTSGSGALYPPNSLHSDVLDEVKSQALAPTEDDIWYWAMAQLNGSQICVVKDNLGIFPVNIYASQLNSLYSLNSQNDTTNKTFINIFNYYPLIKKQIVNSDNIIISLTSYPARINTVNQTIETLLNQSMKADKVILWLAPEQFPNREKDLPQQLLDLRDKGLTIDWYHDIKSYKKLIPTLKKYPEAIIITADDDILYPEDWVRKLYKEYCNDANTIWCHRAHYIKLKNNVDTYKNWSFCVSKNKPSYRNFCTCGGGVLYPPHCFYKDITDENKFMSFAPLADDIWFWAMLVMNNKKINIVQDNMKYLKLIDGTQETSLWATNKFKNDEQLSKILKAYPQILKNLRKEKNTLQIEQNQSLIAPYLFFPYYLFKVAQMRKKVFALTTDKILSEFTKMRVDIKNSGTAKNALSVTAPKANIDTPTWFTNARGIGQVVQGNNLKQTIKIKAINDGKLIFDFRGQDKRDKENQRIPLWCDYQSIKIDGKKINDKKEQTWHDKPYHYEMPVKDGQEVKVEIEQAHHRYMEDDLRDTILELFPNDKYITENIDKLTTKIYQFIEDKNKTVKTVKIIKQVSSVKLFNLIPIATFKQRGGKKVWKILGLPVWKKRTSDNKNIKYYLFGLPILRLNKKSAEVVVNK